MTLAHWLSALGLLAGAGMGLAGMLSPRWSSNLVRLRDDPDRPGGYAEFRATYGGLFFAAHSWALWLMWGAAQWQFSNPYQDSSAAGAVGVCGAIWLGTAAGRALSMMADGANTRFNAASVVFEGTLGLGLFAEASNLAIALLRGVH